jgi:hypothetical protein
LEGNTTLGEGWEASVVVIRLLHATISFDPAQFLEDAARELLRDLCYNLKRVGDGNNSRKPAYPVSISLKKNVKQAVEAYRTVRF